jgi:4-amino-4-deoxy-L-arabinose transferase-like glycosyltransferase
VNDEGTYFAVAQSMAHGFRLYAGVWENKPPAIYVLYEAVYRLVGPSLISIRLVTALAVLGLVAVVYGIARHFAGGQAAFAAALLSGLLMGTPFLEGTTANAEVFVVLLSATGVWLGIVRARPALGGVALGGAVLFKAVAGFDAVALGLWLLINDRRKFAPYATAVLAVLAVAIAACGLAGILPEMLRDAVFYDLGYVGKGNGGGLPVVLVLKLAALAALTVALRRKPYPYLWLAYAAAGALLSGRIFGHYVLQVVPALCIVVVMLLRPAVSDRRLATALCSGFLGAALGCATLGWALAASGHDSIAARRLQYYANFARYALRTESRGSYQAQVDDHVNRNIQLADALKRLPPGRLVIWGNTPWIYVLSDRLPATPYTSALRQPAVPGETSALRRALRLHSARQVVVIRPPAPLLGSASQSLARDYRVVTRVDDAVIYASRGREAR